ncbi:branched-chain amino acid ABC transporter permease [Microbacterium esteraromaticum]|uniref:Branched-chain amino acid ABC transporter permease n=1 Tax=Microbacterium esteraromaticum TaxID=57043 RepID=A0A939IUL7_9MICO|nr:branched-chain amino acid ABC transporter permease [Microbacterium esteraromaticum]MBN8205164.1 branched-chain amino acid ABC transporter permease [Microbacterium esteraromaticum]MBN8415318.1 branched-chain amino acid ABC transporter permease [Microbacterium esteraromaticum]
MNQSSRGQSQLSTVAHRLTGAAQEYDFAGGTGRVSRAVRRGRPSLYTSYTADQALLNTPVKRFWFVVLLVIAVAAPFLIAADLTYLLTMAVVYAIGGIGLNLLTGYAGQVSLGHAFFLGLGAYTAAVLGGAPGNTTWGLGLDLAIVLPAAAVIPGVIGLIVAPLATRVRGLYLAVLTLGLLILGEHLFKIMTPITGGQGVGRGVAQRTLFGADLSATYAIGPVIVTPAASLYLLCLVLLVVLGFTARNLMRGRYGRAFAAVRDRDIAAEVMGVNLLRTKTLAFALSSAYAGIAGALFSMLIGRIAPEQWNLFLSIDFLAVIVIGGIATISGTLIGACFVVLVPRLLEELTTVIPWITVSSGGVLNVFQLQTIVFGVLIILFITLEPRGLFGLWVRVRNYFKAWPFSY